MELEKAVFTALSESADLLALIPTAKIFPDGDIQNVSLPTIKHFVVDDESIYTHSGRVALRHSTFYQVSVYARTLLEARRIGEKVIDALSGVHAIVGTEGLTGFHTGTTRLPYDEDVRAVGIAINFSIWYGN